jgi:hypothetical protein
MQPKTPSTSTKPSSSPKGDEVQAPPSGASPKEIAEWATKLREQGHKVELKRVTLGGRTFTPSGSDTPAKK